MPKCFYEILWKYSKTQPWTFNMWLIDHIVQPCAMTSFTNVTLRIWLKIYNRSFEKIQGHFKRWNSCCIMHFIIVIVLYIWDIKVSCLWVLRLNIWTNKWWCDLLPLSNDRIQYSFSTWFPLSMGSSLGDRCKMLLSSSPRLEFLLWYAFPLRVDFPMQGVVSWWRCQVWSC